MGIERQGDREREELQPGNKVNFRRMVCKLYMFVSRKGSQLLEDLSKNSSWEKQQRVQRHERKKLGVFVRGTRLQVSEKMLLGHLTQ